MIKVFSKWYIFSYVNKAISNQIRIRAYFISVTKIFPMKYNKFVQLCVRARGKATAAVTQSAEMRAKTRNA